MGAPEVLNKDQRSTKSDLWAVGITMYELIVGELPFPDNLSGPQLLLRIANFVKLSPNINPVQVPPNNIISNSLTDLVNKLLIVDPAKRISLDDFLDRLESCNTIADDEARKRTIARLVIKLKKSLRFKNIQLEERWRDLTLASERERKEKEKLKRERD